MGPVLPLGALMALYGQVWGRGEQTHESLYWRQQSAGPYLAREANFQPQISEDSWSRQSATERQPSLMDSPLLVAFIVSTVVVGAQLLPQLLPILMAPPTPPTLPSVSAGDPSVVLLAGGYAPSGNAEGFFYRSIAKVETIPVQSPPCHVPDLPEPNSGSTLVLTPQRLLLNCGGIEYLYPDPVRYKSCLALDVAGGGGWTHHSDLTNSREGAVGVTLPTGTYLFGGDYPATVDFLPASSSTWQAGPVPPDDLFFGSDTCGLAISDTEIVFIGGDDNYNRVTKYSTVTNEWTVMASLTFGRSEHACTLLDDNIIVAGGMSAGIEATGEFTAITEIIPLSTWIPRPGGNLAEPRRLLAMVTLGGQYPKVLAIGGYSGTSSYFEGDTESIEEWQADTEKWEAAPMNLTSGNYNFGAIAIPSGLICPKN